MGLTKLVLRRPVSTVLAILCLIVFGLSSVMKSPLELMPDMNMSMMIVMTVYAGASPDDVNELVTKPIEDRASTLSGLDTISSQSKENMSIVMVQYEYGTNMDTAYIDLKKAIDSTRSSMPEDAEEPNIIELDINAAPVIRNEIIFLFMLINLFPPDTKMFPVLLAPPHIGNLHSSRTFHYPGHILLRFAPPQNVSKYH